MDEYTQRLQKIEAVLHEKLPESYSAGWAKNTFGTLSAAVRGPHIAPLTKSCRDLLLRGGKRWRPMLMVLSCELAGGSNRAYALTPLVEFAHTASLIHDDIEDNAEERRGQQAIHRTYGEDTAINSATWLYFQATTCIDSFPGDDGLKYRLYKNFARNMRRLHLGQAMDIAWHRDPEIMPVRAEYEAMVALKTGTLAQMSAELGMLCAGKSEEEASSLGQLASDIGVGFQIIDDVKNISTGNPGKNRGDDIVEGKKSLPVILHLMKHPDDAQLIQNCFVRARSGGVSDPTVEVCIRLLTDSGSIEEARLYGESLVERSSLTLQGRYPNNPVAEKIAELFTNLL